MIKAVFTAKVEEIKISGLMQWDRGQMLEISCPDLPAAFQVHFTNRARAKAIPVNASGASNTARVAIPDELLREPYEVLAYLYFTEGDTGAIGETVKTIRMPVIHRVQPEDYVLDLPQEQLTDAEMVIAKMMDTYATQAADTATAGALAGINNALSNLPEGDTLVINDLTTGGESVALSAEMGKTLGQRPNPNLLINSYFQNLVNQRGQTEYINSIGYTIDGWATSNSNTRISVGDGVLAVASTVETATPYLRQNLKEKTHILGKTVTFSALMQDGTLHTATSKLPSSYTATNTLYCAKSGVFDILVTASSVHARVSAQTGGSNSFIAVKLELGYVQTLAHRDENGNWVLNEIPDYGDELRKCQRYYQLFSSEEERPKNLADYRPAMRANPATGTIGIDGVTYYYADANL